MIRYFGRSDGFPIYPEVEKYFAWDTVKKVGSWVLKDGTFSSYSDFPLSRFTVDYSSFYKEVQLVDPELIMDEGL